MQITRPTQAAAKAASGTIQLDAVMIKIVIHKANAMPPTMRQPGRKRHGRCQCRE